jgi:hypothetical protein
MPTLAARRIRLFFGRGDAATTAQERGQALEGLLVYIMERIPGLRLMERDVRNAVNSEEIDLIFWNDRLPNGLPFLPYILIFECKNWHDPVDSVAVRFFLEKLRTRHLEYGFMIAANGITGNEIDRTAAYDHIGFAFTNDRCGMLVFTRDELLQITHTDAFIRLIQDKIGMLYMRVR